MFNYLINWIHVNILMSCYSLRNIFIKSPIWLSYTSKDIEFKANTLINNFLNIDNNTEILDLGCGNGIMLEPFLKYTNKLYGVDLVNINILECKKKFNSNNFICDNILDYLKNNKKTFDIIIIHGVIGYFTEDDQIKIINKCIKILNKNGKLILGAIQYEFDEYIYQTYPMTEKLQNYIINLPNIEIYNEFELYKPLNKYSKNQRTILINNF